MAGMSGLGRVFDVIPLAAGVYFSMKNASAVSLVCTTSTTTTTSIALTAATTYSAGTTSTWTTAHGFGQTAFWYKNTTDVGTAGWAKQTSVWTTNSLALAGTSADVSVVPIFTSQFADTYCYLNAAATNCTIVAILHDLTVQRAPDNLAILGA